MRIIKQVPRQSFRRSSVRAAVAGILAAAVAAGSIGPSAAFTAAPGLQNAIHAGEAGVVNFEHHFWRNHPQNSRRVNDRDEPNDATRVDAGITALATGAAGDAMIPQGDRAWDDYCHARYRSYEPATGTYLGYDGAEHPCT